jgi:hypothetical protein
LEHEGDQPPQPSVVGGVDYRPAVPPRGDKPRPGKDGEVRGHRVLWRAEVTRNVSGWHTPITGLNEEAQHRQAVFLREGAESFGCMGRIHNSGYTDIIRAVKVWFTP